MRFQLNIESKPDVFHVAQYNASSIATGAVTRPVWYQTTSDPFCIPLEKANNRKPENNSTKK